MFSASVEKDGSPASDEKQTIQTSLFALLKDFLKAPSPEELHCVLAFALSVGEEKQVTFFLSQDPPPLHAIMHQTLRGLSKRLLVPHLSWQPLRNIPSLVHISSQVVKALDVLYELLRSSPPREQVQTALLDWGAEQLYCLLLTRSFGDKVRERVFRVRTSRTQEPLVGPVGTVPRASVHSSRFPRQILFRLLKSERVHERHKQRVKLKDFGYLGLVCFLEDIPVTMVTVQCLYGQVLATGTVSWKRWGL